MRRTVAKRDRDEDDDDIDECNEEEEEHSRDNTDDEGSSDDDNHRGGGASIAPEDDDAASIAALAKALHADLQQKSALHELHFASEPVVDEEGPKLSTIPCYICNAKAVYTCPGCSMRTCSLACVKQHKSQFKCSGERDLKKVIPLKEFTDLTLARDLHLLEDCQRVARNCAEHFDHFWRYHFRALPPPLFALREAAKKRGVICQIVSEGMSKRDRNTSRFDRKSDTLIWRCEFAFVSKLGEFTVATDWGSERYLLKDILTSAWEKKPRLSSFHIQRGYNRASRWISTNGADDRGKVNTAGQGAKTPQSGAPAVDTAIPAGDLPDDDDDGAMSTAFSCSTTAHVAASAELANKARIERFLELAACPGAKVGGDRADGGFSVLHKAERLGNRRIFHHLNMHATLHDNLRALFFVNEFPEFLVVLDEDLSNYEIATEADRIEIRESFRKRPRPEETKPLQHGGDNGGAFAAPTRETMTDEQLARSANIPCRQFQRGTCARSAEECPYLHCSPEDVPVCKNMIYQGECKLGHRCSFSHDQNAIDKEKLKAVRGRGRGGRGGGGGSYRGASTTFGAGAPPPASMIANTAPMPMRQHWPGQFTTQQPAVAHHLHHQHHQQQHLYPVPNNAYPHQQHHQFHQ